MSLDGGFECHCAYTKSTRKDAADLHVGFFTGGNHFIAACERYLERLFNDDMLSGLSASESGAEVVSAGGAKADGVNGGIG